MTDNTMKSVIEDWVNKNIKKEFDPIDINDVYAAFEAGSQWQSQQAQGERLFVVLDSDPFGALSFSQVENDVGKKVSVPVNERDDGFFEIGPLYAHQQMIVNWGRYGTF